MATEERTNGILLGKYELGRQLGHGTFAKVYHARNLKTGKSVAMKMVGKEKVIKVGMTDQIQREIAVMKMVKHPNIVELHEVMASKSNIYFAMELVRGGELFSKIAKGRLREHAARSYFQQLISAIDFCHSRGVYHRDLNPENLMLDEEGNLKVADFGLSAFSDHIRQDGLLHTRCGTPAYVAPEVIGKKGYDGAKAYIWSCGVILYVLLPDSYLFKMITSSRCIRRFIEAISSVRRGLITKMLDTNPSTRITIPQVMESPWFKKAAPKKPKFSFGDESTNLTGKECLNAFHIISLSEGFDLSPLFEEKKREEKQEIRFATMKPVTAVVSKLEAVAKAVKFSVKKSGDESSLRLQGHENGRKGKLGISADIFAVTSSFFGGGSEEVEW